MSEQLTKKDFDAPCRCYVIKFGQQFNPCYGVVPIEITEEQIESLRRGKVLYTNDGEYATIIRLAERGNE